MTHLHKPSVETLVDNHLDITEPLVAVEVLVRKDKKTLWINIDGVCVLRVCRIPELQVNQEG